VLLIDANQLGAYSVLHRARRRPVSRKRSSSASCSRSRYSRHSCCTIGRRQRRVRRDWLRLGGPSQHSRRWGSRLNPRLSSPKEYHVNIVEVRDTALSHSLRAAQRHFLRNAADGRRHFRRPRLESGTHTRRSCFPSLGCEVRLALTVWAAQIGFAGAPFFFVPPDATQRAANELRALPRAGRCHALELCGGLIIDLDQDLLTALRGR
jgi:hypothetical protein